MRKVDDGKRKEKRKKKRKEKRKKKRMPFLVATTSLPTVYRLNDDRWNAARSCQNISSRIANITTVEGSIAGSERVPPWRRKVDEIG